MTRIILVPGYGRSDDGEIIEVTAQELANHYGVPFDECEVDRPGNLKLSAITLYARWPAARYREPVPGLMLELARRQEADPKKRLLMIAPPARREFDAATATLALQEMLADLAEPGESLQQTVIRLAGLQIDPGTGRAVRPDAGTVDLTDHPIGGAS